MLIRMSPNNVSSTSIGQTPKCF